MSEFFLVFQGFVLDVVIIESLRDINIDVTDRTYIKKLGEEFEFDISLITMVDVSNFP